MNESTSEIDKNGIKVFEGDRLYYHTTGQDCMVVRSSVIDELLIHFDNSIVYWNSKLLEIWDMEVV